MNRILKLSFALCCHLLLLLCNAPPATLFSSASQIYTSRNECISQETLYEIKYRTDSFEIAETIVFTVLTPVKNCYFFAEDFILMEVTMTRDRLPVKISVDEIGGKAIAVQLLDGTLLQPNQKFSVTFKAYKLIHAVDEGLVFKVYRDLWTMKMSWYSIVKIGPANCGKVYICINSLRSVQKLTIVAIHPKTHRLLCPGVVKKSTHEIPGWLRTECHNTYPVGVNNMHYSLANFLTIDYDGILANHSPHRFSIVAPRDKQGLIYYEIVQQFEFIRRVYSLLLLTINLKPFHVFFYALPNHEISQPEILSGVCYFDFEDIHFQLDLEVIYRAYLRCLLHQGFMNQRSSDSWSLHYAAEGLFEKLLAKYKVYSTATLYYRDAIEGGCDELAALAKQNEDVAAIRQNRPWRKAAGFFTMLAAISPTYADLTYSAFVWNNETALETTYSTYLKWITGHSSKLGLKTSQFLEVLDTWTMAQGYPVIVVDVLLNRTVCVDHYNVGSYLRSYIIPIQVDFNFPSTVHSKTIWTNPRAAGSNCVQVVTQLYPYLINSYFNMVGRVMYDVLNWRIWAAQLMKAKVREGLGAMRKVTLVTDALYFAGERKLSYSIALRFLFAMQTEESEEAWRNFDRSLQYLDAKIRYTGVYTLFRKTIAEVSERYYSASGMRPMASEMAYKWSCMMGHKVCLNESELAVEATLMDHRFRHLPEVLCAGMRRLTLKRFHALINTMGRPDWREPEFYVQMMLCAENPKVLRELMHHLFFHNSWQFRKKRLTDMLLKMIRSSRMGSDSAFYYLNHDPEGMVELLGYDNVLLVIEELVLYVKENQWYLRFMRRLKMKGLTSDILIRKHKGILQKLKNNKKWYNTEYADISKFFMLDFGTYLKKFEWDTGNDTETLRRILNYNL